jgi:hypothetical protein
MVRCMSPDVALFETCRAGLAMSVARARPEVAIGTGRSVDDPGCVKTPSML